MVWIALCAGVVTFVSVSWTAGGMRRVCPDVASGALRVLGASGMFALVIATATEGALIAACVAFACGIALTLDPVAMWRRASTRIPVGHSATVTPFQNAT